MTTTTLDMAFDALKELPQDMQDELASQLLSYVAQWRELIGAIDKGSEELARDEGIPVDDIDAFVGQLETKHGRK